MSLSSGKKEEIINFLVMNIAKHPTDIVSVAQDKFGISRTSLLRYLNKLHEDGIIEINGNVQKRTYAVVCQNKVEKVVKITPELAEDRIWREMAMPILVGQKENVFRICEYGFSEIFNNAIDHSEGTEIIFSVEVYPDRIDILISDDGVGIFNKIQRDCHLDDPYEAILELSKGKLTTNTENHTGEGIFFTSRMFDLFSIFSDKLRFGSQNALDVLWEDNENRKGTVVKMEISTQSARTTKSVFDEFADVEHGFDKTVVPVDLVRYGNENLVSRSQAKRMLSRLEKFKIVMLDFNGVNEIGRAFADEAFRVFQVSHPNIMILTTNTTQAIDDVIKQVKSAAGEAPQN
jgi:DNA-binding Lrp family transcriptional regulator